ncbi:MAG: TetR/AcrR family transcriptional regulator [Ardenticatenaceae bacterium]|nr:TetR/AcrR family transcriptional regulator [Ardenticatenaceae bacterium]MCB8986140.1 TetR/AcrR family transcriptional regulator [Ardenticatenaceae bacterium]
MDIPIPENPLLGGLSSGSNIPLETVEEGPKAERRDAAANRQLILKTAEALFAVQGVAHVNMADIALAAGVGKGTLYRRFASKAELCLGLMDEQMVNFQNQMLAEFRRMTNGGVPFMTQLEFFLDALVRFTEVHAPLLCEVQRAGLIQEPNQAQLPHFWQYMTVNGLLQTAVSAGELPQGLDIAYLADAILAPVKADIFQFQRQVRGFSVDRISEGLRVLVSGLRFCATHSDDES